MAVEFPPKTEAARPRSRRRGGRSQFALFALFAAALGLIAMAVGVFVWTLPLLREREHLHRIAAVRVLPIALGSLGPNQSPARRDHLRQCYTDPQINIDQISWNMPTLPTPWLGYAPEPGSSPEGKFNRQQLRAPRDLPLPKPAGEYRIFIVGGSFAYSAGANGDPNTIAVQLEHRLRKLPPEVFGGREPAVWNAAVCGYTSTHERLLIDMRLSQWQPDLILSLTGVNDVHWGFEGVDVRFMRSYDDQMFFELLQGALRVAKLPPYYADPATGAVEKQVPPAETVQRFLRNQRLTLAGLDDLAQQGQPVRYMVALQPTLAHKQALSPGESDWMVQGEPTGKIEYLRASYRGFEEGLRQVEQARRASAVTSTSMARFDLVELRNAFDEHDEPMYVDMYHVGDKGNAVVADALAARLAELLQGTPAPAH